MNNNKGSFPKYQLSYFIKNGAQIVVRADDSVEWHNAIAKAVEQYPMEESKTSPSATTVPQNTLICEVHKVALKEKVSKSSGKPYKAHYRKVGEDWDVCFGKGWMSEKEGESSEEIGERL